MTIQKAPEEATYKTHRRTVVKGAAWSLPVLAVATTVPMAAATMVDPPDPCEPPVIPGASAWATAQRNVHQGANHYPNVGLGTDDDGRKYVRSYVESGEGYYNPPTSTPPLSWGDGWVWGYAELTPLVPGATYVFSYSIRANYGTQAGRPNYNDPDHINSFRADIQGFVEYFINGQRNKYAVTPRYSTRANVAPTGAVQIPNVHDSTDQGLNNKAWTVTTSDSFTVPLTVPPNTPTRFTWEFTEADRASRPYSYYKDGAAYPGSDPAYIIGESKNDDIDVTYPLFTTADCTPPTP